MNNFKLLLNSIAEKFKSPEFTKSGETFYIRKCNNWGLINFQKSRESTKAEIIFTMNIGICSASIAKFMNHVDLIGKPEISRCHWETRVGSLMPENSDFWWRIDNIHNSFTFNSVVTDVITTFEKIILPTINDNISDDDLIRIWTENNGDVGTTEFKRLIYLTILLKAKGDDRLFFVIKELIAFSKNKPLEFVALDHIEKLNK